MADVHSVNIYRRRKGSREEPYRFLVSETASTGLEALAEARRTLEALRSEFPDHDFIVLRAADPLDGWLMDDGGTEPPDR